MAFAAAGTASADGRGGLFAAPQIEHERCADGTLVLRSRRRLGNVARAVGVWLERWAAEEPDRTFLAAREGTGGWREVTYRQAERAARSIGQALLERDVVCASGRPILILADNGLDHALLVLGAMHVGVPVAPVSTAYARLSRDFAKLRYIYDLVDPSPDLRR